MPIRRLLHKLDKGHVFVYSFDGHGYCHFFDDGDRVYITATEVHDWFCVYIEALMAAKKAGWLVE